MSNVIKSARGLLGKTHTAKAIKKRQQKKKKKTVAAARSAEPAAAAAAASSSGSLSAGSVSACSASSSSATPLPEDPHSPPPPPPPFIPRPCGIGIFHNPVAPPPVAQPPPPPPPPPSVPPHPPPACGIRATPIVPLGIEYPHPVCGQRYDPTPLIPILEPEERRLRVDDMTVCGDRNFIREVEVETGCDMAEWSVCEDVSYSVGTASSDSLSPRPAHVVAQATLYWDDQIKVPSPACLGLPGSAVPSLAKLCVRTILDAGVYFRSEPSVVDVVVDEMRSFPFLDLKAFPRRTGGFPDAVTAAIHRPLDDPDAQPALNVSVDLLDTAARIYDLAVEIDACSLLAIPTHVAAAVARYERFIGLQHAHPDVQLVPALDILAVWFSHIIRTDEYKAYCLARFHSSKNRLVDRKGPLVVLDMYGKLLTPDDDYAVAQAVARTGELWAEAFGELYAVNLAELYAADVPDAIVANTIDGLSVAEIIRDRDWLPGLQRMAGPHGTAALAAHDPAYLTRLIRQYERFVYLNALAESPATTYLTVAYDADLIWHAHQLFPSSYEQDCLRIIGRRSAHVPWPDHPPERDAQNTAMLEAAWQAEFGVAPHARSAPAS